MKYANIVFSTVCVNLNSRKKNYIEKGIKLVNSIIHNSKYPIVVLTNEPDKFKEYENNSQVIIYDTNVIGLRVEVYRERNFNMHLKRHAMETASNFNPKYIIYLDGDGYLTADWNDEFALKLFDELDSDVYRSVIYHVDSKRHLWKEVTDFLWNDELLKQCYAPQETHIVFKNNEKFKEFNELWKSIEENYYQFNNTPSYAIGVVCGICICLSQMTETVYSPKNANWVKYFDGLGLNHMNREVRIIARV
jgi:hypothetical protein